MRKKMLIWTVASFLPIALAVAGNVSATWTGPSGQGDLQYVASATTVTNMVLGTGGLYRVTFDPRYPITGALSLSAVTVSGNATVGGATTTATLRVTSTALLSGDVSAGANVVAVGAVTSAYVTATTGISVPNKSLTASDIAVAAEKVIIGGAGGEGVAQTVSGDISINSNGVVTCGGLTTNQTMPQLGVTNILCFTNGLLQVVLYP